MTKSSPVIGIKENVLLWLETSLTGSINENQASDGVALTTWNDQSTSTKKPSIAAVNGGPTYANTINGVHAVKFANGGYLEISDASFLNNTDYIQLLFWKNVLAPMLAILLVILRLQPKIKLCCLVMELMAQLLTRKALVILTNHKLLVITHRIMLLA